MPATPPQIDHVPEPLPEDESRSLPQDAPRLETPVIQSQDLEHQPRHATRTSNKGVKITPHLDGDDHRDFAKEDEEALRALEEFEKHYQRQAPG